MQKSIRLYALPAALSLCAATSLHAEQMGTNPHPQAVQSSANSSTGAWSAFVYTVRGYLGL